jgi:Inosine-uridine preferring nucleoside hydrolase
MIVTCLLWSAVATTAAAPRSVPIIYSTDLLHPHDDPDDHFDLATLFALDEFDIRAIVLDQGDRQAKRPGTVPVTQMEAIAGRTVRVATGLAQPLASPDDDGRTQPEETQGGITLILGQLEAAKEPVTLFTTGSLRDVAAALNRDPALFSGRVARIYANAGNGQGLQDEWNVKLDPNAYRRVMTSGLPICWCPCFGEGGYSTHWKFVQGPLFARLSASLLAYLTYALVPMPTALDPVAAARNPDWTHSISEDWWRVARALERPMWCTAPMVHAAGRAIYRTGEGQWEAVSPEDARGRGLGAPEDVFAFEPAVVTIDDQMRLTRNAPQGESATTVFRQRDAKQYDAVMESCLANLLSKLGR